MMMMMQTSLWVPEFQIRILRLYTWREKNFVPHHYSLLVCFSAKVLVRGDLWGWGWGLHTKACWSARHFFKYGYIVGRKKVELWSWSNLDFFENVWRGRIVITSSRGSMRWCNYRQARLHKKQQIARQLITIIQWQVFVTWSVANCVVEAPINQPPTFMYYYITFSAPWKIGGGNNLLGILIII